MNYFLFLHIEVTFLIFFPCYFICPWLIILSFNQIGEEVQAAWPADKELYDAIIMELGLTGRENRGLFLNCTPFKNATGL